MGRIRTIKPEFFMHDGLAALGARAQVIFIGLWTQADRDGRLQDRPLRLQAHILPYDHDVDFNAELSALARGGFIVRYASGAERYIAIPEFSKHQRPHMKEAPSEIPPPSSGDVQAPTQVGAGTILGDDEHARKGREGNGVGKGREGDAPKSRRRWRRLPPDEALTAERLTTAATFGLDAGTATAEWAGMADWEYKDGHSDVDATWRTWCRRWAKDHHRARNGALPLATRPQRNAAALATFLERRGVTA